MSISHNIKMTHQLCCPSYVGTLKAKVPIILFFSHTDYTKELFDMLYQVIGEHDEAQSDDDDIEVPPPLCSKADRPNKAEAVNQLYSRFQT